MRNNKLSKINFKIFIYFIIGILIGLFVFLFMNNLLAPTQEDYNRIKKEKQDSITRVLDRYFTEREKKLAENDCFYFNNILYCPKQQNQKTNN